MFRQEKHVRATLNNESRVHETREAKTNEAMVIVARSNHRFKDKCCTFYSLQASKCIAFLPVAAEPQTIGIFWRISRSTGELFIIFFFFPPFPVNTHTLRIHVRTYVRVFLSPFRDEGIIGRLLITMMMIARMEHTFTDLLETRNAAPTINVNHVDSCFRVQK